MNQEIDLQGTKFDGGNFTSVNYETRDLGAYRKLLARGPDDDSAATASTNAKVIGDPENGTEVEFLTALEKMLGDFHSKVKWKEGGSELEKMAVHLVDKIKTRMDLNKSKDELARVASLRKAVANA